MNKTNERKRIKIAVVLVLALAVLFGCIGVMLSNGDVAIAFQNAVDGDNDRTIASNSTNISGNLLSSDTSQLFNKQVFWKLIQQVTGNNKIISNDTLKSYASTTSTSLARTSANFRTDNGGKDVVVYIDGIPFTATYLTKDNSGNVILTLWQADVAPITYWDSSTSTLVENQVNVKWSTWYGSTIGKYPSNSYGTSFMSTNVLNNGGQCSTAVGTLAAVAAKKEDNTYAKFTMSGVSGSIADYIVKPSAMSYQSNAIFESAKAQAGISYDLNNDSLGTPTSGNFYTNTSTKVTYKYHGISTVTQGNTSGTAGYLAWGNDYIWLPSMAEVGYSGDGGANSGLWKTSTNQRSTSMSVSGNDVEYCWLRSSCYDSYSGAAILYPDGATMAYSVVSFAYAVRPAFHLNLTSAGSKAGDLGTDPPTDVTENYNGDYQSIQKLIDDGKEIKWYDATRMRIDYPSASQYDMMDAGTYTVKVTITTDDDVFDGNPDPSKGDGDESGKIRYFDFKINPLKIKGTLTKNGNIVTFTLDSGQIFTDVDTEANGRAPTFAINYKNKTGTPAYDSTTLPTTPGNYTATVIISNTNTCKSYVLDKTYSTDISVDKKDVTKPSLSSNATIYYTGREQEIALSDVTDDVSITTTANSGIRYDTQKKVLIAKDAKTYTVTLTLADSSKAKWSDGDTRTSVTMDVTIEKAEITISFIDPATTEWSWNSGVEKAVKISDDRKTDVDGNYDVITYKASVDGKSIASDKISSAGDNKTSITVPKLTAQTAKYALKVELGDASSSNHNGNYTIVGANQKLITVADKEVEIKEEYLIWSFSNNNLETTLNSWSSKTPYEVTYNGKEFTFSAKLDKSIYDDNSIDISADDEIKISSIETKKSGSVVDSSKNAGDYTTTVTITSSKVKFKVGNNTQDSVTLTLTWKINKAKFDLTGVTWDYDETKEGYPFEYNTGYHEVKLQGLPTGLVVEYDDDSNKNSKVCPINSSTNEYNPYTATAILKLDKNAIADIETNYVRPIKSDRTTYIYKNDDGEDDPSKAFPFDLQWTIKKGTLDLDAEWEKVPVEDSNGMVFRVYKVAGKTVEAKIEYEYYAENDWDNDNGVATGSPVRLEDIQVNLDGDPVKYWVVVKVNDKNSGNYEIKAGTQAKRFTVGANIIININMDTEFVYDGKAHGVEDEWKFDEDAVETEHIVGKWYSIEKVQSDNGGEVEVKTLLESAPKNVGKYLVALDFDDEKHQDSYALSTYNIRFEIKQAELDITLNTAEYKYDGNNKPADLTIKSDNNADLNGIKINYMYYKGEEIKADGSNRLKEGELPNSAGKYIVVLSIDENDADNFKNYNIKQGCNQFAFDITKAQITANWNTTGETPVLDELTEEQLELIEYVYIDEDGVEQEVSDLQAGQKYTVIARIKAEYADNYEFVNLKGEVLVEPTTTERSFEIKSEEKPDPAQTDPIIDEKLDEILDKFKVLSNWQLIVIIISIVLILIFISKTISYNNKRKKFVKKAGKFDTAVYAGSFLGLAMTAWTAIAGVCIGLTVLSFVAMLISKSKCAKAEEEYEECKAEADERKRDESMKMMLMGMMGGNAGGQGFGFAGQGVSADDMRLMINDAVTAMLPNVQQYLPQPTVGNDDAIKQIIKTQEELAHNQDLLMKKLAEQPVEKVIAREVAVANANDETIKSLVEGQKAIMERLAQLSAIQVVEKEVPVEKVVEKIIEIPVEKIVEKEVRVEVPVEVEKTVEKEVNVKVEKSTPAKPKKEIAPKLTLDEAYAGLSKQQQKYFDGLRQYALAKDKCKEKKSTYFTVFGHNTANPLLKLTIKKDTVVALYKMEDEYMKDIRRNATSDGSKIKVKETELVVADAQAFKTAKDMIDLREDQIARYEDFLKEQKAMSKRK